MLAFLKSEAKIRVPPWRADLAGQTCAPRIPEKYIRWNFHYEGAFVPQVFTLGSKLFRSVSSVR